MILGTGIDLVEVARIESMYAQFGERLLDRILLPAETAYCRSQAKISPSLAARFAAKEAISKAFGTGIGAELGWLDMEVVRQATGAPVAVLHGKGLLLLQQRGGKRIHLSLSHTHQHAIAMAIIEG